VQKKIELNRREFIKMGSVFTLGTSLLGYNSYGAPGVTEANVAGKYAQLIPADKRLDPEWLRSLFERGTFQSASERTALDHIGMPVGGMYAGTVYLGGDGRLWYWNIRNDDTGGVEPRKVDYKGQKVDPLNGGNYIEPVPRTYPFEQNFGIRINGKLRTLDADGFDDVSFVGQYPIGEVSYADAQCPVSVQLSAFSPFIPMNTADSSLPVTVMSYQVRNDSSKTVECDLFGWLENPVCLRKSAYQGTRRNELTREGSFAALNCTAVQEAYHDQSSLRSDVVFEDFEGETYGAWTVEGSAFGAGPIALSELPNYQGNLGAMGKRTVNSHATAPGASMPEKDAATGSLTSPEFTVSRKFLNLLIGGGAHKGSTCANVLIDGAVVESVTGSSQNKMAWKTLDLSAYEGKTARIQVVDTAKADWGNVGVDQLIFSDTPRVMQPLEDAKDFGTMALAVLADADAQLIGAPDQAKPVSGGTPKQAASGSLQDELIGSVGRTLSLQPGEAQTVTFILAWNFPNLSVTGIEEVVGREYAARFDDALAVTRYVSDHSERLFSETRLWRDTWYDSSLPHWFLDRTMANTSILATTTVYRFRDGRFWAWEGVGCCPGTCTHVWHYAQAPGRLFPEVERQQRENVDFGLAMHDNGGIGMRSTLTGSNTPADDGQSGRILGAYREHQMSEDSAFLERNWPNIKRAMRFLINRDLKREGILQDAQHNTLDAEWYGRVSFLASLYLAALRACEAMALEVNDASFARECKEIADTGAKTILELYNGEYFFHELDPKHIDQLAVGTGCYIDQLFGQFWAHQVGLGYITDPDKIKSALRALYKYNFAPNIGKFRDEFKRGRWYAMNDDKGLIMCSWPKGGLNKEWHKAWQFMYFNECMSGFEWQAAAHMISEGLVEEGMAVSRAIHDRYDASLRNPYNEIECSDHYSRAMASYGTFISACGYESHGPQGYLGFAPKVRDGHTFKCAFTAAGGWGSYEETTEGNNLNASLLVKWGAVKLKQLGLEFPAGTQSVTAQLDGKPVDASLQTVNGKLRAVFDQTIELKPGQVLSVRA
jgi:non-lysosomal glucosylceramidase